MVARNTQAKLDRAFPRLKQLLEADPEIQSSR